MSQESYASTELLRLWFKEEKLRTLVDLYQSMIGPDRWSCRSHQLPFFPTARPFRPQHRILRLFLSVRLHCFVFQPGFISLGAIRILTVPTKETDLCVDLEHFVAFRLNVKSS